MGDPIISSLSEEEIEGVLSIGAALAAERNITALLGKILHQCRSITGADAGSLFLAEGGTSDRPTHLRFQLAENDSITTNFRESVLPIDSTSLVGYVAKTGKPLRFSDVYHIPRDLPYQFNPDFDKRTGYRSKSLLSVAMIDHRDQLIGVIQLWNKKKTRSTVLTPKNVDQEVISFSDADHRLLESLASQAAIVIENASLYQDIEQLFEGFIRASIKAIESRDPTTSGHSERVAILTVALAEEVSAASTGPYSDIRFTPVDLKEINYASLLHDFGKIGVREAVLVKAKKLYPFELENVRDRFDLMEQTLLLEIARKKLDHILAGGKKGDATWKELERDEKKKVSTLKEFLEMVHTSNEPTVLPEGTPEGLHRLGLMQFYRSDGTSTKMLTPEQVVRLSIPKGSLSVEERLEIQSHVSHTYAFLRQIPWTRDLRRVPDIAHAHHEKLDGSGYPRGIKADEIPLPSRIMAVADIFDALAARDRHYKRAVPVPKALEILDMEAKEGQLDKELVRLFTDRRVYERTYQKE